MAKTPLLPAVAVHSAEEDMVATRMWHMEAEARRQAKRVCLILFDVAWGAMVRAEFTSRPASCSTRKPRRRCMTKNTEHWRLMRMNPFARSFLRAALVGFGLPSGSEHVALTEST